MPVVNFCLWCQTEGELVANKLICSECNQKGAEQVQSEHEQRIKSIQNDLRNSEIDLQEAQTLLSKLQQDNRDLLNDIHQYKQKITTHEQTITQLKNTEKTQKENLAKFQEKWDNQLTREKSFLQREIQLIKEVLNG